MDRCREGGKRLAHGVPASCKPLPLACLVAWHAGWSLPLPGLHRLWQQQRHTHPQLQTQDSNRLATGQLQWPTRGPQGPLEDLYASQLAPSARTCTWPAGDLILRTVIRLFGEPRRGAYISVGQRVGGEVRDCYSPSYSQKKQQKTLPLPSAAFYWTFRGRRAGAPDLAP